MLVVANAKLRLPVHMMSAQCVVIVSMLYPAPKSRKWSKVKMGGEEVHAAREVLSG
jgi:hypothetical protein